MTLNEAIRYGLGHHRTIENQRKTIEYMQWQTKIQQSAFLPKLQSSADYRRNTNLPVSVLPGDAFGQQDTPLEIQMGTKNAIQAGLNIHQSVYDAGKFSMIRQTEINTRISKNELDKTRKRIAINIKQAYFQVMYYKEILGITKMDLDS